MSALSVHAGLSGSRVGGQEAVRRSGAEGKARAQLPRGCLVEKLSPGNLAGEEQVGRVGCGLGDVG